MAFELSQEDMLLYQRATSAIHEVLEMLGRVSDRQAASSLHHSAAELSRELETVLATLLERPIEPDPGPVLTP